MSSVGLRGSSPIWALDKHASFSSVCGRCGDWEGEKIVWGGGKLEAVVPFPAEAVRRGVFGGGRRLGARRLGVRGLKVAPWLGGSENLVADVCVLHLCHLGSPTPPRRVWSTSSSPRCSGVSANVGRGR